MKKIILLFIFLSGLSLMTMAQVSINETGNDPNASAMLDVSSTDKGILIPRMTSIEREAIVAPANGLLVFDITTNTFWFYKVLSMQWVEIKDTNVSSIDDLIDAKNDNSSLYLGHNGGSDDGNNKNTATGKLALSDNTSGQYNAAYGYSSLNYNTTGIDNTAFGSNSLEFNTTGNQNTAIGSQSLFHNAGGSQNTAVGYMSGYGSVGETSTGNVFIGYQAGFYEGGSNKLYIANSNTYDPLIYGDFVLSKLKFNGEIAITGGNPGLGKVLLSDDLGNASWGFVDPANIENVLIDETSIFFGANTGIIDDGTNYNTAFGHGSMEYNTQGNKNTTIGFNALRKNTLGNQNTAIGYQTLYNNTTGSGNIAIGNLAGYNATSSNSIFIGTSAGFNATADNQLYIDNTSTETPLIHGDFENDELRINGSVVLGEGDSISYSTPLVRNMRIHSSAFVPATRTTTTAEISYFETHMEISGDDVVVQAYAPINIQSNWVIKGLVYYADVPQESTVNVSICYFDPFGSTIQTEIIHSAHYTNGVVSMFTDFTEAGLPFNPRSQFYIKIDLLPNANLDPLKFYGAQIVYEITNVE
jgi:hypothetical protein